MDCDLECLPLGTPTCRRQSCQQWVVNEDVQDLVEGQAVLLEEVDV